MTGIGAPEPRQKPESLQSGLIQTFQFRDPPNTAGMARLKIRHPKPTPPAAVPVMPRPLLLPAIQSAVRFPVVLSPPSVTQPTWTLSQPGETVPYSTQQYRKRKAEKEQEGMVKRSYMKTACSVKCSKCGEERKPPTHQQYMGYRYCQQTDQVAFLEWRAALQAKGVARKKKP